MPSQRPLAGAAAMLLAATAAASAQAQTPPTKPTLHAYDDYGWLRGLNCIPSWGARIEEAWWEYDPQAFREEMALVRRARPGENTPCR